ncbi:hypothetical protein Ahia01_000031300, partial [Argonauta hians]
VVTETESRVGKKKPSEIESTVDQTSEVDTTVKVVTETESRVEKPSEIESTVEKPSEIESTAEVVTEKVTRTDQHSEVDATVKVVTETESRVEKPTGVESTVEVVTETVTRTETQSGVQSTVDQPTEVDAAVKVVTETESCIEKQSEVESTAEIPTEKVTRKEPVIEPGHWIDRPQSETMESISETIDMGEKRSDVESTYETHSAVESKVDIVSEDVSQTEQPKNVEATVEIVKETETHIETPSDVESTIEVVTDKVTRTETRSEVESTADILSQEEQPREQHSEVESTVEIVTETESRIEKPSETESTVEVITEKVTRTEIPHETESTFEVITETVTRTETRSAMESNVEIVQEIESNIEKSSDVESTVEVLTETVTRKEMPSEVETVFEQTVETEAPSEKMSQVESTVEVVTEKITRKETFSEVEATAEQPSAAEVSVETIRETESRIEKPSGEESTVEVVTETVTHTEKSSEFETSVESKVEFTQKIKDVKVKEKEQAVMKCEVSKENLKVTWKKNGKEIKSDDHLKIVADVKVHQLIIENVTLEDIGEYSCVVGDVSTSAVLSVEETKPEFSKKLANIKTKEKQKAVLICELSKENVKVTWKKNGKEIQSDNHLKIVADKKVHQIIIENVTLEDIGEYTCVAGDVFTSATLSVEELKPEFTKKLTNFKLKEKEEAVYNCELFKENVKVIWKNNGKEIQSDNHLKIVADMKIHQIIIENVTLEDIGEYSCVVGDVSTSATLSVEELKPEFTKKLTNLKLKEKEKAVFVCELSKENVKVTWKKNDKETQSDNHLNIVADMKVHQIIIENVTLEDIGEYSCVVGDVSTSATLCVEELKSEFTKKLTNLKMKEKEKAVFVCELSKENVKVTWKKNGKEIQSDNHLKVVADKKVHQIIIENVTLEDIGEYTCVAGDVSTSATLSVEVTWKKNGKEIQSDNHLKIVADKKVHQIIIENVTLEDIGEYTCVAGDVSTSAILSVEELKPEFTKKLTNLKLKVKEKAVFICELSKENVKVTWKKNGNEIQSDNHLKIVADKKVHQIIIENVTLEDIGEYTCVAGDVSTSATLSVEELKPEFTKKLTNIKMKEKEKAVFICELSKENVKVTWKKNGKEIQSDNHLKIVADMKVHQIIIENVTLEDIGEYTCVAGDVSTSATLSVEELKPEFTKKLTNLKLKEKEKAVLVCELSKENVKVTWKKNGKEIQSDNHLKIVADMKVHQTIIENVTLEDIGEYTCVAGDVSTSATLSVEELKPEFTKKLTNLKLKEKEKAVLVCELSKENMKVTWKKNGKEIQSDNHLKIVADMKVHQIIIENVTLEDIGEYTCVAGDVSTSATLSVEELKPEFTKKLTNLKLKEKENAVLVCELSKENVKVTWKKNGKEIQNDNHLKIVADMKVHQIIIENVTLEDIGEYTCVAGDVSTSATLSVEELKPEFTKKLTNLKLKEKEKAVLVCELSKENVKVTWKKNGKEIQSDNHLKIVADMKVHQIIIENVTLEDIGEYTCVAGDVSTSATLSVEELKPEFTKKLTNLKLKEKEKAVLVCELSKENVKVTWKRNGKEIQSDNHLKIVADMKVHQIIIENVTLGDIGEYTCVAGDVSTSATLSVEELTVVEQPDTELKPEFTKKLTNLKLKEKEKAVFVCELSKENVKVTWKKNGKEIQSDNHLKIVADMNVHQIIIENVTLQDIGEYTCVAGDVSTSATLSVEELKPEFTKKLTNLKLNEKEKAVFVCELSKENVKVTWKKNGKEIQSDNHLKIVADMNVHQIIIENVTLEDIGEYTSAAGDVSTSATLSVQEDIGEYSCVADDVSSSATLYVEEYVAFELESLATKDTT